MGSNTVLSLTDNNEVVATMRKEKLEWYERLSSDGNDLPDSQVVLDTLNGYSYFFWSYSDAMRWFRGKRGCPEPHGMVFVPNLPMPNIEDKLA